MKDSIRFAGVSDVGCRRDNNEDAYVVQTIWNDTTVLAVAIDGVGGYDGGERAAALAQEKIVEYLENYPNGELLGLLKRAVIYANNAIYNERSTVSQYSRMSCVLTAVLVDYRYRNIYMAHVGDTRLYSYVDGELVKLSHDHSYVGYLEEVGELSEEEAMQHPERNVISRDVGSQLLQNSEEKFVEVASFTLPPSSILMLCSDGLCDMITSLQMKQILQQDISIKEKCDALVAAANEAGGRDNVTVVLVETHYNPDAETAGVTPDVEDNEPQTVVESDEKREQEKSFDAIHEMVGNIATKIDIEKFYKSFRRWKIAVVISWIVVPAITICAMWFIVIPQYHYYHTNHEEQLPIAVDTIEHVQDSIFISTDKDTVHIEVNHDRIKSDVAPR